MEFNTGNLLSVMSNYNSITSANTTVNKEVKLDSRPDLITEEAKEQTGKKELSKDELDKMTGSMNKLIQLLNADLQFALHEKTNQIMVQIVDTKENKVLKEFPPHELLDTISKIRDYIGLLLDKKV